MIETPEGYHIPYYIDLPGEIGEVTLLALNGGESHDLVDLAERYVTALESYMSELKVFVDRKPE